MIEQPTSLNSRSPISDHEADLRRSELSTSWYITILERDDLELMVAKAPKLPDLLADFTIILDEAIARINCKLGEDENGDELVHDAEE